MLGLASDETSDIHKIEGQLTMGLYLYSGDQRVVEALELMNSQGVSSLAVVDGQHNVIGNISATDVKVGSNTSLRPLSKRGLSALAELITPAAIIYIIARLLSGAITLTKNTNM